MTQKLVVAVAALAATLTLAGLGLGAGSAKTTKFTATLNNAQEVPKPSATGGSGAFTATLKGHSLSWKLTFKNLSGPATGAHIHLGKRGVAGPIAITLCGLCISPAQGNSTVSASQLKKLKNGGTYVNVHTLKNLNGEIRGQIRVRH
jgi:hypothetical protein